MAVIDNPTKVPTGSQLAWDAKFWNNSDEYHARRYDYERVLFSIMDIHFTSSEEDSANVDDLFKIPDISDDITSSSVADINMVYVTPINCRLIQPTYRSLEYVIQQDAMTEEWSRYDPSARSWVRDDSVGQFAVKPFGCKYTSSGPVNNC